MLNVKATFKELADDKRLIQEVREVTVAKFLKEDINDFFTLTPGIKGGQQVAAMRGIEKVTTADAGCSPTFTSPLPEALEQTWNPKRQSVRISYCHTDFEAKFLQWGLANGYNVKKLDESDFFNFIVEIISEGMYRDTLRIALMGDSDISTQNILGNANDVPFYNSIQKGLLPTMEYFKTVAKLSDNFIPLSKNAGASRTTLDSTYAKGILEDVVDVVDFEGDILLTSHSLFRNYNRWLKSALELESSKKQFQEGIANLRIDNQVLTPVKNYDRWRKNDFTTSGEIHLPHFAIFTRKEYLQLGVDSEQALTNLEFEYPGGKDENFYIKGNYSMDFKMTNPYDFKTAI